MKKKYSLWEEYKFDAGAVKVYEGKHYFFIQFLLDHFIAWVQFKICARKGHDFEENGDPESGRTTVTCRNCGVSYTGYWS